MDPWIQEDAPAPAVKHPQAECPVCPVRIRGRRLDRQQSSWPIPLGWQKELHLGITTHITQPLDSWDKCWGLGHEGMAPLVQLLLKVLALGRGEVTWVQRSPNIQPLPASPSIAQRSPVTTYFPSHSLPPAVKVRLLEDRGHLSPQGSPPAPRKQYGTSPASKLGLGAKRGGSCWGQQVLPLKRP